LPARRLSVRKIKEVLRLKFEVGLGLRQIARSCSIGLGTAHEYLQRAEAAKITWPLGPEWDDDRLEAALFGGPPRSRPAVLPMPDFADLHRQRQQHSHVTQQLLWEEYRQANPDGYQYSRFCELYQCWRRKQAEHRPRSHQAHLEWTPSRMVHWAQTIGPNTARLFERILADKPHPEMGYRSCLGVIRLADQYSPARVDAAAQRALLTGACRYQSVKSILKNSLDVIPPSTPPPSSPPPPHDNIRGAEYFE
jgi:transposase